MYFIKVNVVKVAVNHAELKVHHEIMVSLPLLTQFSTQGKALKNLVFMSALGTHL